MDQILALRALAAVVADDRLRERFVALTGYDGATLRARAAQADVQRAVIAFLASHEPDLLAIAELLDVSPAVLADAA